MEITSTHEIMRRLCMTRLDTIRAILAELEIPYKEQEFDVGFGAIKKTGTNIIVSFHSGNHAYLPEFVIAAHHDIDPGTKEGANDNTAAVTQVILAAKALVDEGFEGPVQFVLTDYEEPGNGGFADGAYEYALSLDGYQPHIVLVLDVSGHGEVLVIKEQSPQEQRSRLMGKLIKQPITFTTSPTPGGDDIGFARAGIESVLCCTLPEYESLSSTIPECWQVLHTEEDIHQRCDPENFEWVPDVLVALAHVWGLHRETGQAIRTV